MLVKDQCSPLRAIRCGAFALRSLACIGMYPIQRCGVASICEKIEQSY